jgi:hypothetical protein
MALLRCLLWHDNLPDPARSLRRGPIATLFDVLARATVISAYTVAHIILEDRMILEALTTD